MTTVNNATVNNATVDKATVDKATVDKATKANATNVLVSHAEVVARRNALMVQSTANQNDAFKEMLTTFRQAFPSLSEVTEIIVSNGGLKGTQETRNTTILLYIVQLGSETFNGLFDSFEPSESQRKGLTKMEISLKAAEHALSVYRAMIIVDKFASKIERTSKFTNNALVNKP